MIVRSVTVGPFGANCYLLACPQTGEAALIDPGGDPVAIMGLVARTGARVRFIINTHAHVDHVGANADVKRLTGASILIHEADAPLLTNPVRNLSLLSPVTSRPASADRTLSDGEEIEVGTLRLKVLHTPGHTPGGICLHVGGLLFSGDTLFAGSVGRTDFPGGSMERLLESIRVKLSPLDDATRVLPGHGPATTIGAERSRNPYWGQATARGEGEAPGGGVSQD
ncbi:MAG: MBL fold metallo-hydrolase [Acetobacteraceae bacterium]|nr:MBL fold metallo-hydrolase [Acetobacteraceae bacterium]